MKKIPRRKRWDEVMDRLPRHEATLVEVGVWRGDLAAHLLAACPRLRLVLVDPWRANDPIWRASGATLAQSDQAEMEANYRGVVRLAKAHGDRVRILRLTSRDASECIADGSCDAVFLDADHSQAAVSADIAAWLPKVRPGGWIGGHDYGHARFPGVAVAVDARFSFVDRGGDGTWFAAVDDATRETP